MTTRTLSLCAAVLLAAMDVTSAADWRPLLFDEAPRFVLVVNSLDDDASPPRGTVTLRSALSRVFPGGRITFDRSLDGRTIRLRSAATEHTILMGEVFEAGKFQGYGARDYGRSALFVKKRVTIDASSLPNGITLAWDGEMPARVLAVLGDLRMRNVTIASGYSRGEPIEGGAQTFTLARGGGLAIWGTATLERCTFHGNRVEGDATASRDRGAFGGAIYGNLLVLTDCVIGGNEVKGYGAAGGGVYSVGGRGLGGRGSSLTRCTVSGNRVSGEHAYGGGIYSDGGGPGSGTTLSLVNTTIARNAVLDNPDIGEPAGSQYYYRGGGVYMSNGSLDIAGSTIVENAVTGLPAVFKGKPNMGGGAIAATIGDAHVVEQMAIRHSIIAGNTVNDAPGDVYTGSLVHFFSGGYNRIGDLDFSQILVPVPPWWSLSRKHWPKEGDREGVALSDVVSLGDAVLHDTIRSAGVDPGERVVLRYPPSGDAVDAVPSAGYTVSHLLAQFTSDAGPTDGLLEGVLESLRTGHADVLGEDFGSQFDALTGTPFDPVPVTWPSVAGNAAWIQFWRDLEAEIDGRLGACGLGDAFWGALRLDPADAGGRLGTQRRSRTVRPLGVDQLGNSRRTGGAGDIGAVERTWSGGLAGDR